MTGSRSAAQEATLATIDYCASCATTTQKDTISASQQPTICSVPSHWQRRLRFTHRVSLLTLHNCEPQASPRHSQATVKTIVSPVALTQLLSFLLFLFSVFFYRSQDSLFLGSVASHPAVAAEAFGSYLPTSALDATYWWVASETSVHAVRSLHHLWHDSPIGL